MADLRICAQHPVSPNFPFGHVDLDDDQSRAQVSGLAGQEVERRLPRGAECAACPGTRLGIGPRLQRPELVPHRWWPSCSTCLRASSTGICHRFASTCARVSSRRLARSDISASVSSGLPSGLTSAPGSFAPIDTTYNRALSRSLSDLHPAHPYSTHTLSASASRCRSAA